MLHKWGVRYGATTALRVLHVGRKDWYSAPPVSPQ